MKFDMNIFLLSAVAFAVVHASEDGSEEARKLQGYYNDYSDGYYNEYSGPYSDPYKNGYSGPSGYYGKSKAKKSKGKGKKGGRGTGGKYGKTKRGAPKGKYPKNPKAPKGRDDYYDYGPEPSDCAERYCDSKFKAASYGGYYFTREDCKWTPSKTDKYAFDGCKIDSGSTYAQKEACKCFWDFEAQCETNVFCPSPKTKAGMIVPGEREINLAKDVEDGIINDGLCYPSYYRKLEVESDPEVLTPDAYYDQGYYGPYDKDYYDQGYGKDYYAPAYPKCPFDTCFSEDIYNCFCKENVVELPKCYYDYYKYEY